jgi:hypothetical protein
MKHSDWPEVMAKRDAELKAVLNKDSVIWEVGGYLGDWVQYASDMFGSQIHVYEPVFHSKIYTGTGNVFIHTYGLERADYKTRFFINKDATGLYELNTKGKHEIDVLLVDVLTEIKNFERVDFVQLNCECGEYGILDRLLECLDELKKIKRLRVQFHKHPIIPENKRDYLIEALQKLGYIPVYSIPYYWEEWELAE